ncbi:hypothetical protein MYAM1_003861 [Malassezia yamatoensis]|uniref:Methyltransferase type 12 domain-containing protein n=1 Tax=Malassezia yamatoensis TaxID=253288 RepID=A0AAJ6CIL6_9BASI|nr:hypothetical protein MYAM1_003861 [Malassezia yamatoensis]
MTVHVLLVSGSTYADPVETIDKIFRSASTGQAVKIVEIGSGTGIATRLLLQAGARHDGIKRLGAYEPSIGMLHHLRQSLFGDQKTSGLVQELKKEGKLSKDAEVVVEEGAFDSYQAGSDNDLVVVAQAFHWCPDLNKAVEHFAQSLRRNGVLALLWNLEDRDAAPWVARVREIYEQYEAGAPQYRHMQWKKMLDTPSFKKYFETLDESHQRRSVPTTIDGVVDRMLSKSYISVLPEADQIRLVKQVRSVFDEPDAEIGREWIDKAAGVFTYPYGTDLFLYRRKEDQATGR